MKRVFTTLFFATFILALTCNPAWSQATAQINGTVSDATGAVLPGVDITATQTATGIARSAVSNETGSYVLPNLSLGPYRLEVSLPGFQTFVQTGIVLTVNDNPVINAVMQVGQVAQTIEVQATAALVETRSVGIGTLIENERILELPLNGRNVAELIELSGGAVETSDQDSARYFGGTPIVVVAGGLGVSTDIMLDGAVHTDRFTQGGFPLPFPDALQEFRVETSGLSAENRTTASVGAVTKSGTNQVHGNAFWFVRNDLFNARPYFSPTESTLKRNQFGGTVGGPIVENELFFFAGYQRTTLRSDPGTRRSFTPTAAMRNGDFTAFASPACGRNNLSWAPNGVELFNNNVIDPSNLSSISNAILADVPVSADPCGEIFFGIINARDDAQFIGRIDWQATDNHSIFGRWMWATTDIAPGYIQGNVLTANQATRDNFFQAYTIGSTYLIGTNTVQSARLVANRVSVKRIGQDTGFDPTRLGINVNHYIPYLQMSISDGFQTAGPVQLDGFTHTTEFQLTEDLSMIRGDHQISLGGSVVHGRSNTYSNVRSASDYNFDGGNTGEGLSDFMVGALGRLRVSAPNRFFRKKTLLGIYGADSWRVTPDVTLNYGLRWEPDMPMTDVQDIGIFNFDIDRFRQGVESTVYPLAPAGYYAPGDPGFPGNTGRHAQWGQFSPRLGLAWDVRGDGRTSVRVSGSMTKESMPLQFAAGIAATAPPWAAGVAITDPIGGFADPYLGFPGGDPFPIGDLTTVAFPRGTEIVSVPYDFPNPTVYGWNLAVQQQIGDEWMVSGSYIGTQLIHLWLQGPGNRAIYFPGTASAAGECMAQGFTLTGQSAGATCSSSRNTFDRRVLSLIDSSKAVFGAVGDMGADGTQSYHGLIISIQRRAASGVTVNMNYTWSHCITDDIRGGTGVGNPFPGTTYTHFGDRTADRGNCQADRRHIVNLTSVARTPEFENPTTRKVLSGWQLSGIFRISSGQPLDIQNNSGPSGDRALADQDSQRPNQILSNVYGNSGPGGNFLNRAAFAPQAIGTLGNMGKNSVRGLKNWALDLSLSRTFSWAEAQSLEFRAEAYNITNSFRGNNPERRILRSTFGRIRSAQDSRILQFALKYGF